MIVLKKRAEHSCSALIRRILADDALPIANLFVTFCVDIDWRNDGACRLIEVNLRGLHTPKYYDLNRLMSVRSQIYDAGTVSLYLAFGIDPSPLILPTPIAGRSVSVLSHLIVEEVANAGTSETLLWDGASNPNS